MTLHHDRTKSSRVVMLPAAATALISIAAALASIVVLQHERDIWVEQAVKAGCRDLQPLPSATLFGGLAIVLSILACAAIVAGWTRSSPPTWLVLIALAMLVVAAGLALYGIVTVIDAPSSPYHGVDGSGLPCGSG